MRLENYNLHDQTFTSLHLPYFIIFVCTLSLPCIASNNVGTSLYWLPTRRIPLYWYDFIID